VDDAGGARRAGPFREADDRRLEPIAATFGALALVQLAVTFVPAPLAEPNALVEGLGAGAGLTSLLRWAGLALGFALFAWKARNGNLRRCAWLLTGLFAYGALAQRVPGWTLPIAPRPSRLPCSRLSAGGNRRATRR
jgi:hypothetical protein